MPVEVSISPGNRYKILPPRELCFIPDKFMGWAKEVSERIERAGLGRLKLLVLFGDGGELSLGYEGDRETVQRLQRLFHH